MLKNVRVFSATKQVSLFGEGGLGLLVIGRRGVPAITFQYEWADVSSAGLIHLQGERAWEIEQYEATKKMFAPQVVDLQVDRLEAQAEVLRPAGQESLDPGTLVIRENGAYVLTQPGPWHRLVGLDGSSTEQLGAAVVTVATCWKLIAFRGEQVVFEFDVQAVPVEQREGAV